MSRKRTYGGGGIEARGLDTWRLRYSVGGRRYTATLRGSKAEAKVELRRLLRAGDTGEHVDPVKVTLADWARHWCEIGCPGRRRQEVAQRTKERYVHLMAPVLKLIGDRSLQRLEASAIDTVYAQLAEKLSPGTMRQVHTTLGACLGAACEPESCRAIRYSTSPRRPALVRPIMAKCSTPNSCAR
jgi:integrase